VDALVSKRESAQDAGLRLELQRQIEAAFLSLSR
jgi:hypothetical protein